MATPLKPRDPTADSVGAHVRLTPQDYETVRAMATRERRSISAQLSVLVTWALAELEGESQS